MEVGIERCSKTPIRHRLLSALVLGLLACGSGTARELDFGLDTDCESGGDLYVPAQGGGISLQDAINMALARHPGGRVVRATTVNEGGRRVHQIRIVLPADEGGRVVTMRFEAGSGR